eukprot:1156420-Pelagomonas_calceolata.AAC.1
MFRTVAPLTNLTKKDVPYEWSEYCQTPFEQVKHALTHAPLLSLPDFTKPFEVICDASIEGFGPVLLQEERSLAFESRKLILAERNYTTGEQEFLCNDTGLSQIRSSTTNYLTGLGFRLDWAGQL